MKFLFKKRIDKSIETLDLSGKFLKKVPKSVLQYPNLRELNLSQNQLTQLPEFLKELKFLKTINVNDNQLTNIPDYFFEYQSLEDLDIANNKISKFLLTNNYYNFSLLKVLDIGGNPLSEIPTWIWKLHNLESLSIHSISLNELSKEIGNLKKLENLLIDSCGLTSLPESIGYLRDLENLWAEENNLSSLPSTFDNLNKLRRINFSLNKFKKIPNVLFELKSLVDLHITQNELEEVPENIINAKSLVFLDLMDNRIREFPESFYSLNPKKTDVWFEDNPYSKETKRRILKMFPDVDEDSLCVTELEKVEWEQELSNKKNSENTKEEIPKARKNFGIYMFFGLPIIIWSIFLIFYFSDKNEKTVSDATEKESVLVEQREAQEVVNILERLKEVQVYTNDTVQLELNLDPDRRSNDRVYARIMRDKHHRFINNAFENRSYGYTIKLNNQREKLNQMQVYDSLIPPDSIKKFKFTSYYKLEPREKKWYRKVEEIRDIYDEKQRKDTVFGVFETVVRLDELTKGKFNDKLKFSFLPLLIKLNREEYYFYFSPLSENISRNEFLIAIEKFNKMFIKKGDPKKHCVIQNVAVH